jgi:hypothetical protein
LFAVLKTKSLIFSSVHIEFPAIFASDSIVIARRDGQPELRKSIGVLVATYFAPLADSFSQLAVDKQKIFVGRWMIFELDKARAVAFEAEDDFKQALFEAGNNTLVTCAAFVRSELARPLSSSDLSASVVPNAMRCKLVVVDVFSELCNNFADIGDNDDAWLLDVMQRWWATVKSDVSTLNVPETKKQVHTITANLVNNVLKGVGESEVNDVQAVMCSLVAFYFAAVAERVGAPWLRCFVDRVSYGLPVDAVVQVGANLRYFDAASFASTSKIDVVDTVAHASTVMSFEFKRSFLTDSEKVVNKAFWQSVQDAADVIKESKPGDKSPCLFSFAGTATAFDLVRFGHDFNDRSIEIRRFAVTPVQPNVDMSTKDKWVEGFASPAAAISLLKPIHRVTRHVVHMHDLGAGGSGELVALSVDASSRTTSASTTTAASSSTASAVPTWRVPRPLMAKSNFRLPAPIAVRGDALSRAFKPFGATVAPVFPVNTTLNFVSVVAATERRLLCCVQLGTMKLVLKFADNLPCGKRERDRVARIVDLFSGDLSAHRNRVRLPLGYITASVPTLVSEFWPGHSLAVGRLDDTASRKNVRTLLTEQVWPVIDAMRDKGYFYIDLHPGNVMVNDDLTEAWLIDFDGATELADALADEEQLFAAINEQKDALLKQFE